MLSIPLARAATERELSNASFMFGGSAMSARVKHWGLSSFERRDLSRRILRLDLIEQGKSKAGMT